MKPQTRNLEEVKREVAAMRDGTGQPVDEKIKPLVIGLRRWGVETESSCQGHCRGRFPFPYVDVIPESFEVLRQLLTAWWIQSKSRWVVWPLAGFLRAMPENKGLLRLWKNQREAQRFGRFLQEIPGDWFE